MKHKHTEYCPYCRRVTEHVFDFNQKLCKRCGKINKKLNALNLLIPK